MPAEAAFAALTHVAPEPMQPMPYRVVDHTDEAARIVSLRIVPVDRPLSAPQPGQFMMLWIFGVGEVPISVSRTFNDGTLEFTIQAVGATSTAMTRAAVGDVVGLRGPFGTAWPLVQAADRDLIVMAGGLGLAPLRMAIDSLADGNPAPKKLTVLVGAREPATLLYPRDLARWQALGATVLTTVDIADRSWSGSVGVVTTLLERHGVFGEDASSKLAFVCGPEPMMVASVRGLMKAAMDPEQIYVSLERNMHCGIAHCGRCQLGSLLLCRDGAVVRWDTVSDVLRVRGR